MNTPNQQRPIANTNPELTPPDDRKKRVSEMLKRVEQLIKSGNLDLAQLQVDEAKRIDPRNFYTLAFEERIQLLNEEQRRYQSAKPAPASPQPQSQQTAPQQHPSPTPLTKREVQQSAITPVTVPLPVRPVAPASAPIIRPSKSLPYGEDIVSVQKPTSGGGAPVLVIIDDDKRLLELLAGLLQHSGFEVKPFATSDAAFGWLHDHCPDFILCDINLETSTMGGFSFYERIREIEALNDVPFVFLTGLSDEVLIRTGKELGADDYLTKPISEQMLIATIRGKIKRYQQLKSMREKAA